jgi:DNA-binding transcriptional LysR family regulator
VARRLNFSRAAEELHLSQPAVSRHIRVLEAELGVLLFQRLGSQVELTDAGRIVADYAQRVSLLTEEVRRVLGELAGLQRGYLRLGASTMPGLYVLLAVLARFQEKYPGIEASLSITNSADVTRRLLSGEFDLGFIGVQAEAPRLQVRPFTDDEIVLVTPPGHAFNQLQDFSPEMLAGETLIVREPGSSTRQIVEAHLAQWGMKPKRVLEMSGARASSGLWRLAWAWPRLQALDRAGVGTNRLCAPEIPKMRIARSLRGGSQGARLSASARFPGAGDEGRCDRKWISPSLFALHTPGLSTPPCLHQQPKQPAWWNQHVASRNRPGRLVIRLDRHDEPLTLL